MEVGGLARERLIGGAESLEGHVPGVGKHHKPDHARHERVIDDDKNDNARQCFVGRWLSKSHGSISLAHNFLPCSIHELCKPANTSDKETSIDIEQDDSRITVRILPVSNKGGQCEECAEDGDRTKDGNVDVHGVMLAVGEERILTLDPAAFHILIPALRVVCTHQGSLAAARSVKFYVLNFILASFRKTVRGTLQKVRPASLPLHNGAGASGDLAHDLAGQFHSAMFTFWHVNGAQELLNHSPTAWSIT